MSPWATAVITIIVALITAAGRDLIMAILGRGRSRVDATRALAETAIALNSPLREEFKRLQDEMAQERRTQHDRVSALNDQIGRLTDEASMMADELRVIRTAVFAPDVTIDGLRDLIRRGPNNNRRTT